MTAARVAALLLALCSFAASGAERVFEAREFRDPVDETRYHSLISELRCLVCQNQSIADSNADLAAQLRDEVHSMIEAGETDQQIVDFMVERYGDFVRFRPPIKAHTLLLWFGPFAFLAIGLTVLVVQVRRQQARAAAAPTPDSAAGQGPAAAEAKPQR
jgi:cytochrome c-type biogenesis protein CcmH